MINRRWNNCVIYISVMIDNFLEGDYHSYDQVYVNSETTTSIFIGDVQAALDL